MTFLYPNVQINHRVIFFLLMLMAAPALGAGQETTLSSNKGGVSQDGHIRLQWEHSGFSGGGIFEVQQAGSDSFRNAALIYSGADLATFVSGLENGTYYFRARAQGGNWSNVVELKVKHHSLGLTFILLGLGGMVFLLTAGIVLHGARKSAQIH